VVFAVGKVGGERALGHGLGRKGGREGGRGELEAGRAGLGVLLPSFGQQHVPQPL